MKQKDANHQLNDAIILLQQKQANELFLIKEQFKTTYESFKPINLLKSTFEDITQNPDLIDNITDQVIGLSSGFLAKKVLIGKSNNPLKNIIGLVLQFAVANVVSKHSEVIKIMGIKLISNILNFNKKSKKKKINEEMNI